MNILRGYVRKDIKEARQPVDPTNSTITELLDASNTTEVIQLAVVAEKVSFQGSGDLAGTIEFSLDGVNFGNSTAIPASNAVGSFSTHLSKAVRVTRTSGSGRLVVAIA